MKKIKSILWSLKSGFMQAPILFVFYVLIQILRATLVVYTTVVLGDIISDVQLILDNNGDIEQIWHKLIMFGVLNIIVWLAVNIQWRFNDDFIPLRASVGASKFLINMVKYIPLRKYDDADFCNKYSRFQDGIRSQNNMLKTCIGVGITIYSFVLSCIVLAEIHFSFIIILSVFFVIEMLAVRSHAEIQDNIRKEVTPFRRRADYLQSMFFGICNRDTRIYGLKDHYIEKWADNKRIVTEKDVKGNTKIERINGFLRFIENGLCPLLMIGIAIWFVNEQMLLIGSIYTVWQISRSTLSNSTTATNRILNFMVQCKQADETYAFYKNIKNNLKIKNDLLPLPESGTPALHIEDMDFSYLPEKKVLHNVNLDVNPGEIIALLGKNGSGKSTLIKLMLGVYSPDKGSVQVFGHNADENEEYIRTHIGTAFQDFCCYPFTLRENVGFGNVSEILDDNKIKSSLSLSQADEILKKAENIDRMLGRTIDNNGIELSGGEWQRVALARAYFGTRDIMIFDEPAAKLDPLAEEKQFANIIKYARENHKTVILVSHRVGFARLADRILFMNDGKITESGSHSDLISLNGEYKQMFDAQREMYAVKEDNV